MLSRSAIHLYKSQRVLPLAFNPLLFSTLSKGNLDVLFNPKSIAIVGATDRPKSVGRTIISNLLSAGEGTKKLYPINPKREEVLGLKCYKDVPSLPDGVDLAVVVTPAASCVNIMRQCAAKNIKSVVVISAGFKEAGPEGIQMEKDLVSIAEKNDIRVIGPNCLGIMSPIYKLNASFAATTASPGPLAFISQSGAMCTAVLDWSLQANVGFSHFVSVGSMADVDWSDLIAYLNEQDQTKAIMVYMETIGNNYQAFLKAAKQSIKSKKPIVVIKSGKSEAAAKAAASHTGSLAGSYASFEAAMQKVGILAVDTIGELYRVVELLAKQPRVKGPDLTIITNAGGPAVLATDAVVTGGGRLTELDKATIDKLNKFLPAAWSHSNPVDILGDASPELYSKTLKILLDDPSSNGILVVLSPQDMTDPTATAKALIEAVEALKQRDKLDKPILASWMGGASVAEGARMLSQAGIPCYANADEAAAAFALAWKQQERLLLLDQRETKVEGSIKKCAVNTAMNMFKQVRSEKRDILSEAESKKLFQAFGIGCVETIVATTKCEAEKAAKRLSQKYSKFAVKLNSKTITHKADVGGVKLNVPADGVGKAYAEIKQSVTSMHSASDFQGVTVQPMIDLSQGIELILGSTMDPQFGPLVMFGAGGTMVEIFKDTALGVPPFSKEEALELMSRTKIYKALKGGQGKRFEGVDLDQLADLLANFSQMVYALKDEVAEIDINPLLSMKREAVALDGRVKLR